MLIDSPKQTSIWSSFYMLYNLLFHPLRKYPGPISWQATRLPWCWYQYRGCLSRKLLELHNNYGKVVRVAPNELSFISEDAWKTIYGSRSNEMMKDPVFSLHTPTGVPSKSLLIILEIPKRLGVNFYMY